jgi:hypothetical protein
MEALKVLFTSAAGLLSVPGFVVMIGMGGYLFLRRWRLTNDPPGKQGWN